LSPLDPYSKISIILRKGDEVLLYNSPSLIIHNRENLNVCGDNVFTMKGQCRNKLFYPDSKCTSNEDDYFSFCADGFDIGSNKVFYDNNAKKMRLSADISAKGLKNVLVVNINNDDSVDLEAMHAWVEGLFDKESLRITGKDLVDFKFYDGGSITLNWDDFSDKKGLEDSLKQTLGIKDDTYDFIVGYIDKKIPFLSYNETQGLYAGNGLVFIEKEYKDYWIVAHEILHGFGAPDFYFNTTFHLACLTHLINDIMCASKTLGIDVSVPDGYRIYAAPHIGWADIDADGIIDVEDDEIAKVPSWFKGLEINELNAYFYNVGSPRKGFSIDVLVLDKARKKLAPSIIKITSPLFSIDAFIKGQLVYSPKVLPTSKIPITVTVEYGGYKDTKTIIFDPNNYKYVRSKYDPKIHGAIN